MNIVQSSLTAPSPPRTEGPEFVQGEWTFQCLGLQIRTPYYQELSANQPSGSIEFTDLPIARFKPRQPMSGADALLSDIGVRQSFVCALVARAPDDALYVLQWIPWYVQWSCEFAPGPAGLVPRKIAARTRAGIGPVQTGVPPILAQVLAGAPGFNGQRAG